MMVPCDCIVLFCGLYMVIPGQNTVDSALAIIDVTPWWAECSTSSMFWRRVGGITIRSL